MGSRHPAPRLGAAAAILVLGLSGLLTGVSQGATGPDTVALVDHAVTGERTYPLRDEDGVRSATIGITRIALFDADGNDVGTHTCRCVNATRVHLGWSCTHTLALRDGPFTDRGTVVMVGEFRGYVGEKVAIVGGTGAYAGARGYATATVEGNDFVTTLHLQS